ncbi:hypothetical protein [Bacillus sp. FJAT-42376]|uniref:hypothetical protein n=1 Tax=Bacillus sp. FJAT-42376 TaxID=2014076 RepID=UPI0013DE2FB2|nr:hypothetical protein [Bacillus sp. FJAT-42376]
MKLYVNIGMILLFGGAFFLQLLGLMNLIPMIVSSIILFAVIAAGIFLLTRKKTFKGY